MSGITSGNCYFNSILVIRACRPSCDSFREDHKIRTYAVWPHVTVCGSNDALRMCHFGLHKVEFKCTQMYVSHKWAYFSVILPLDKPTATHSAQHKLISHWGLSDCLCESFVPFISVHSSLFSPAYARMLCIVCIPFIIDTIFGMPFEMPSNFVCRWT